MSFSLSGSPSLHLAPRKSDSSSPVLPTPGYPRLTLRRGSDRRCSRRFRRHFSRMARLARNEESRPATSVAVDVPTVCPDVQPPVATSHVRGVLPTFCRLSLTRRRKLSRSRIPPGAQRIRDAGSPDGGPRTFPCRFQETSSVFRIRSVRSRKMRGVMHRGIRNKPANAWMEAGCTYPAMARLIAPAAI